MLVIYRVDIWFIIESVFAPSTTTGSSQGDLMLQAYGGEFTIGDGKFGGVPFRFELQPGLRCERGYMKIFLTSKNVDLSDFQQASLFDVTRKPRLAYDDKLPDVVFTTGFQLIQHRKY